MWEPHRVEARGNQNQSTATCVHQLSSWRTDTAFSSQCKSTPRPTQEEQPAFSATDTSTHRPTALEGSSADVWPRNLDVSVATFTKICTGLSCGYPFEIWFALILQYRIYLHHFIEWEDWKESWAE